MTNEKYAFQYCPKIVIFRSDFTEVLLCRRHGESDYDGVFSFPGGKMETDDDSIVEGINREKNEEIGQNLKIRLYPEISSALLFRKKDGSAMITTHYFAVYEDGEVDLNLDEYSEFKWVEIKSLGQFEPKIPTIPRVVQLFRQMQKDFDRDKFVLI